MSDYIEIGFLKKTHGVKGYIHIAIDEWYEEDLANAKALFVDKRGRKQPYFIEKILFAGKDTIKLEEFNTMEEARVITQQAVFLRSADVTALKVEESDLEFDYLKDFTLFDGKQELGIIKEVLDFPQQEMACVEINKNEVFIPLQEALIVNIDEGKSTITMNLPEGLIDITQ